MTDLFSLLAGGLTFLNGVVQLLLKLSELWDKYRQHRRQKGKNKRSTKRNSRKNP
ncbi:MAG: hypothetical protein ACOY4Q_02165 [Bacillota bacterium]